MKKQGKGTKFFLPIAIFVNLVVLFFFGFLLYNSIKSYFNPPADKYNEVKKTIAQFAGKLNKTNSIQIASIPEKKFSEPKTLPDIAAIEAKPVEDIEPITPKTGQTAEQTPLLHDEPQEEDKQVAQNPVESNKQEQPVSEEEKPRAKRVTLTYTNSSAKTVNLVGTFSSWQPIEMKRSGNVWKATIYAFNGTYRYNFEVDGTRILDPLAKENLNENSILLIP